MGAAQTTLDINPLDEVVSFVTDPFEMCSQLVSIIFQDFPWFKLEIDGKQLLIIVSWFVIYYLLIFHN